MDKLIIMLEPYRIEWASSQHPIGFIDSLTQPFISWPQLKKIKQWENVRDGKEKWEQEAGSRVSSSIGFQFYFRCFVLFSPPSLLLKTKNKEKPQSTEELLPDRLDFFPLLWVTEKKRDRSDSQIWLNAERQAVGVQLKLHKCTIYIRFA